MTKLGIIMTKLGISRVKLARIMVKVGFSKLFGRKIRGK